MEFPENRPYWLKTLSFTLFLFCIAINTAGGETHYVTDMLILTLREGPGREYSVIRTLKSNTPVEVLEEKGRHLKVQTKEGDVGWVEKQYITAERPKSVIIEGLKRENFQFAEKIAGLETKITGLMNDSNSARIKMETLEEALAGCQNELIRKDSESEKIPGLKNSGLAQDQGSSLKTSTDMKWNDEITELEKKLKVIEKENRQLRLKYLIWWFIAGGAVFLIGLITGKILSRKPEKKIFY